MKLQLSELGVRLGLPEAILLRPCSGDSHRRQASVLHKIVIELFLAL